MMTTPAAHTPVVTVIMTSFNTGKYVGEAIESLLAQTLPDWELIVADDASTDNSVEVISRYTDPRIRTLHQKEKTNFMELRNKLIAMARGELLTLLDSDDCAHPERLEKQVAAMKADPSLAICGTWVELMTSEGKTIRTNTKPVSPDETAAALGHEMPFVGSAMMMRTAQLRSIGGYRPFYYRIGYEEWDLALRLLLPDKKGCNLPEPLYRYRQLAVSVSRTRLANDFRTKHMKAFMQEFYRQRSTNGKDWLDEGNLDAIAVFFDEKERPYREDPSRIYREFAGSHLYTKLYRDSVKAAWKAVRVSPGRMINWRTFFYCLRKSLFRGGNG